MDGQEKWARNVAGAGILNLGQVSAGKLNVWRAGEGEDT